MRIKYKSLYSSIFLSVTGFGILFFVFKLSYMQIYNHIIKDEQEKLIFYSELLDSFSDFEDIKKYFTEYSSNNKSLSIMDLSSDAKLIAGLEYNFFDTDMVWDEILEKKIGWIKTKAFMKNNEEAHKIILFFRKIKNNNIYLLYSVPKNKIIHRINRMYFENILYIVFIIVLFWVVGKYSSKCSRNKLSKSLYLLKYIINLMVNSVFKIFSEIKEGLQEFSNSSFLLPKLLINYDSFKLNSEKNNESIESVLNEMEKFRSDFQYISKEADDLKKDINEIFVNNNKIEDLSKAIELVAEKNKVMDEIVFQTKLLSFNAAVEAENAGEYGRGFSIVAHEIRNLARMSGKAADEINLTVKNCVEQAEYLSESNKESVSKGIFRTQKVLEAFQNLEELLKHFDNNIDSIKDNQNGQMINLIKLKNTLDEMDHFFESSLSKLTEIQNKSVDIELYSNVLEKLSHFLYKHFGNSKESIDLNTPSSKGPSHYSGSTDQDNTQKSVWKKIS